MLTEHDLNIIAQLKNLLGSQARCVADHRQLKRGDVFFAWPGLKFDARQYCEQAIEQGVCALVLESKHSQFNTDRVPVFFVDDLQKKAGQMVSALLQYPSEKMLGIAVTGTNGKTSVTRWVAQALEALGKQAGVIGTLGVGQVDQLQSQTGLTTPDAIGMQYTLGTFVAQGLQAFAVEASSIGLHQGRLQGTTLSVVGFTNLSRDHLDYHQTMQAYGHAKLQLAMWPSANHVVVNADDPFSSEFERIAKAHTKTVFKVSANHDSSDSLCDLYINDVQYNTAGVTGQLNAKGQSQPFSASIVGKFNLENLAVTAGILLCLGYDLSAVAEALSAISPPAGRMQLLFNNHSPMVVVDYAHTPDALHKVLDAL